MNYKQLFSIVCLATAGAFAGTFTDSRDNRTYETVEIGGVLWFAENLKYEVKGSFCYEDDSEICQENGRLYTFDAAQKACPDGWVPPSSDEWQILAKAAQGKSLKAAFGWEEPSQNDLGFAGLPSGFRNSKGKFELYGKRADFWSSDAIDGSNGQYWYLNSKNEKLDKNKYSKKGAMSVRCINVNYVGNNEPEEDEGCVMGSRDHGETHTFASKKKYTTCGEIHDYGCGWRNDGPIYTFQIGNADCYNLLYESNSDSDRINPYDVIDPDKLTDTKAKILMSRKSAQVFLDEKQLCIYDGDQDIEHFEKSSYESCFPFSKARAFMTDYGKQLIK